MKLTVEQGKIAPLDRKDHEHTGLTRTQLPDQTPFQREKGDIGATRPERLTAPY